MEYDEAPLLIADKKILRKEIKNYLTPEFYESLSLWQRIKNYGLPWNIGWAELPILVFEVVQFYDGVLAGIKQKETPNANNGRTQSTRRGRS